MPNMDLIITEATVVSWFKKVGDAVYFDGVLLHSVENTHWHQPPRMIFNSETMPDGFGMPADKDLPSTYSVEYVRAWKKR